MIFISYRKAESENVARSLAQRLRRLYGDADVFLDESSIRTAAPWLAQIEAAVGSASVALVLMGPRWFTLAGDDGRSRILAPDDVVRLEVRSAFQLAVPVIQLYLDGFEYPKDQAAYPEELRRLPSEQGLSFVLDSDFDELIKRLIREHQIYPRMAAWRKVWRVDYDRNINFRGREVLLSTIHRDLRGGADRHERTCVIHGLAGVGKSQVALQYAYRYSYEYDFVWWMHAEDVSGLSADYVKAARSLHALGELKLPGLTPDLEPEVVDAMRDWLDAHDRWLIILDNANTQKEIRRFIPSSSSSGGHILVTSRNPDWDYPCHHLDVMSESSAVDLLLSMTGLSDAAGAAELAAELGYLPLALAHAGAYMSRKGMELTFPGYLARFRQAGLAVQDKLNLPRGPEATLATTWEMVLERIGDRSPAGIELMDLCSYLAPIGIHEQYIRKAPEALPDGPLKEAVLDVCLWDDCLDAPRSYSMIDKTKGLISLHRLVQMAVKRRLSEAERKLWARTAVALMERIFRLSPAETIGTGYLERLHAHAKAAVREANRLGVEPDLTVNVQQRVGRMFAERAKWEDAEEMLRTALDLCTSKLPANGTARASVRASLGRLELLQGHFVRAEASFRGALADLCGRSVSTDKGVLDLCAAALDQAEGDGELLAAIFTDYAKLLRDTNRTEFSKQIVSCALDLRRRKLGDDAPETIESLNALGELNYKTGQNEEALAQFQQVLAYRLQCAKARASGEEIDPDGLPDVARDIAVAAARDNLGLALDRLGRSDEAEREHLQALDIRERELGRDHIKTGETKHNLAVIYREHPERRAEAIRLLNDTVSAIAAVNEAHPLLLHALETLAWTCVMAADVDAARDACIQREKVQRRMLEGFLAAYDGASESDRDAVSDALGHTLRHYCSEIRIEDAVALYDGIVHERPQAKRLVAPIALHLISNTLNHQRSDNWFEYALSTNSGDATLWDLRGRFRKNVLHDYRGAEECYERALEISPDQSNTHNNLAVLIASTTTTDADWARAIKHYERSLELKPNDATTRGNYAFFLDQCLGRREQAGAEYRVALTVSPSDPNILANQAVFHIMAGDFESGRANLTRVLERSSSLTREVSKCLYLLAAIELLEKQDAERTLACLRAVLNSPEFVSGPWAMRGMLDLLQRRLNHDDFELMRAAWEAISEGVKGSALTRLDRWKALPIPKSRGNWLRFLQEQQ